MGNHQTPNGGPVEGSLATLDNQMQPGQDSAVGMADSPHEIESKRLEALVNGLAGGVQLCGNMESFPLAYVNDGFLRLTGYSREEAMAIGSHMGFIYPEDVAEVQEKIKAQLRENGTASVEYHLQKRDGSLLRVLDNSVLVQQPGEADGVQFTITDITRQWEREQALRLSVKRYEIAMNFSDITIYDYNTVTRQMTLFSSDLQRYDLPKVVDNAVEAIVQTGYVQPESVEDFRRLYREIEEGAPTARATVSICDIHGQEGVFELILTNIFDSKGKPTLAVGVKRDITKSFNLERERQYSHSLASNQLLICEANITRNRVLTYSTEWAAQCDIARFSSFTQLQEQLLGQHIAPEFRLMLREKLSSENLTAVYEQGQRLLSVEYRKTVSDAEDYQWYRMNVNIIRDTLTQDMVIRCYLANINEEKLKELKAAEEQQYYESMVAKSMAVFTVDVTQNLLLSGHGQQLQLIHAKLTDDYTQAFSIILQRAIHPEDTAQMLAMLSRVSLLESYAKGQHELVCEYRRLNQEQYIWARATVHLFEDPRSGNVKAFIYEENIHTSKLRALDLVYRSEHDSLTGFYEKAAAEKYITEFLNSGDGKCSMHALLFLDIDHFKSINDAFGHAYGDEVLAQTSERLREQFRDADILGRVGGDEFIILMKHIGGRKTALIKAQELCNKVVGHFTQDGIGHNITVSVGVALYEEHGRSYKELFRHADTALYISKTNGRSCSTLYTPSMIPMDSSLDEANTNLA